MAEDVTSKLYSLCHRFIADQAITCPEAIYQMDRIIENAPEFIEEICQLVGYASPPLIGEQGE